MTCQPRGRPEGHPHMDNQLWDYLRGMFMPMGFSSVLASLAGFANLLRSGKKITVRNTLGMIFANVVAASLTLLFLHEDFGDRPGFLIFVSAVAGIGGLAIVDVMVSAVTRFLKHNGLYRDGDKET